MARTANMHAAAMNGFFLSRTRFEEYSTPNARLEITAMSSHAFGCRDDNTAAVLLSLIAVLICVIEGMRNSETTLIHEIATARIDDTPIIIHAPGTDMSPFARGRYGLSS